MRVANPPHVLAYVRMVPEHSGVGELHLIREALAALNGWLCDSRDPVESIVDSDSVPMNRGRQLNPVRHPYDDGGVLGGPDQGAGILAIVAEHHQLVTLDGAAYHRHGDVECVPVRHCYDLGGPRLRERGSVHAGARNERTYHRYSAFETRQHRHVRAHGHHSPPLTHRARVRGVLGGERARKSRDPRIYQPSCCDAPHRDVLLRCASGLVNGSR